MAQPARSDEQPITESLPGSAMRLRRERSERSLQPHYTMLTFMHAAGVRWAELGICPLISHARVARDWGLYRPRE